MVLIAIEDGCQGLTMEGSICLSYEEESPTFEKSSTYLRRFRVV